MSIFTLVSIILISEMILILSCLLAIVVYYFLSAYKEKKHRLSQGRLKAIFMDILLEKKKLDSLSLSNQGFILEDLLIVVESFNRCFSDEKWLALKEKVLSPKIMERARRLTKSSNWIKRNRGIRLLSLLPNLQHESLVISLINDPSPLIRIPAAVYGVQLGTKRVIKTILERIVKESEWGRCPYKDALIHGKLVVYQIIEQIFYEETDEAIKSVCLDVLSTHVNEGLSPLLKNYLHTDNIKDKVSIVKILSRFPNKETFHWLLNFLLDEHWQVRAQAAQGLGFLLEKSSISELSKVLQDPIWQVRLEAALALKQMKEGYKILSRQDPDIHLEAYQAAQYVLALPT